MKANEELVDIDFSSRVAQSSGSDFTKDRVTTTCAEDRLSYWQRMLAGASPRQCLPKDRQPLGSSAAGLSYVDYFVDGGLASELRCLARQVDGCLAELLLASFNALLFRYTGQEDLFVGWHTGSATRSTAGVAERTLVAEQDEPFVPVRVSLSSELRFDELFRNVRTVCRTGWQSGYALTLDAVARVAGYEVSAADVPVRFWAAQVLRADHDGPALHDAFPMHRDDESLGELALLATPTSDAGLRLRLMYNADRYRASFIEAMCGHFHRLLESVVASPAVALSDLSLTALEEESQLLTWSVGSRVPLVPNLPHVRFQAHAEQTPDKPAVVFDGGELTYAELDRRANQLAHLLGGLGVSHDVPVAICLSRSAEVALAYLGILKAGGTIFPLAADAPPEQMKALLDAVSPAVIVTSSPQRERLDQRRWSLVCLDAIDAQLSAQPNSAPGISVSPRQVAFLLATSGSTGQAKIVKWCFGFRNPSNDVSAGEHHLLKSCSGTTFTVAEILRPLVTGGTLFVAPAGLEHDPTGLVAFIGQHSISRIVMTPSQLGAVLEVDDLSPCDCLQQVDCSGELVSTDLRQRFFDRLDAKLVITYGCTEAPSATVRVYSRDEIRDIADVWCPAPEKQAFVLDSKGRLSPVGVPGEVFLGGMMSSGYLNDPMGTDERFVAHPFDNSPDARLFRTGDLGRWHADGSLEILGRNDRQVKIRGFRVELGEIEAILTEHPEIQSSIVMLDQDSVGDRRLTAYLVPIGEAQPTPRQMRNYLSQRLPKYMVPLAYVILDALPLTANGKVDRRSLPAPVRENIAVSSDFQAPRDALEMQLTKIWEVVLNAQRIGVDDDFFDLGGHSLLAVTLLSRIEQLTGKKLPMSSLFQAPSVRCLANILREENWQPRWNSLTPVQPGGSRTPLFLVPPAARTGMCFVPLSRYLGDDQPLYSFDLLGSDEQQNSLDRVEDIAAGLLQELVSLQPRGPYLVGGMCFGSHIAFEMAQQLGKQGHAATVLVLDASAPFNGPSWTNSNRDRNRHWDNRWQVTCSMDRHTLAVYQRQMMKARWDYCAKPFLGNVAIFLHEKKSKLPNIVDRWSSLVLGRFSQFVIPAVLHKELLKEPGVQRLAGQIQCFLEGQST